VKQENVDPQDEFDSFGLSAALDAVVTGAGFIVRTPSTWPWSLVPAAILLLLIVGFTCLGVHVAAEFSDYVFGKARGAWGNIGDWALRIVLGILALLLSLVLGLLLAEPLSAFALDKIVRAFELQAAGESRPGPPIWASLWFSVSAAAFGLLVGGTALATLLAISFFFPPATVVTGPLKFVVISWMLAWSMLDYPMTRRRLGILARLGWVRRHFGAFTWFGMAWAAIAVVPGIVLVLLPMGVAGAARLVMRDEPPPTFPRAD
jgi:CysZ protein